MAKITSKQREEIMKLRNQGKTLTEVGEQFGITRQRVHQIIDGVPQKKQACKYCGVSVTFGSCCSRCYYKLKLVRELIAIGQLIRKKAGR